ncbi:hypothetical protein ZEAMMB73_Zm00001d041528 [Zea mays]|uniref:Uncharacterized protein n=1 Tax=Zea mays TaxID=4577 RepID=A0A1D6MWS1_MAIZE|nr:hypothetical protein ZEAMMB73_Zm00001d041528 [Zea mays]
MCKGVHQRDVPHLQGCCFVTTLVPCLGAAYQPLILFLNSGSYVGPTSNIKALPSLLALKPLINVRYNLVFGSPDVVAVECKKSHASWIVLDK